MIEDDTSQSQSTQEDDLKYTRAKKAVLDSPTKVDRSNFKTRKSQKAAIKAETIPKKGEKQQISQNKVKSIIKEKQNQRQKKEKEKAQKEVLIKNPSKKEEGSITHFTKCVLEALYEMNKLRDGE